LYSVVFNVIVVVKPGVDANSVLCNSSSVSRWI